MKSILVALTIGVLVGASIVWFVGKPTIEKYASMTDEGLLEHAEEISQLDGAEGNVLKALLACVGLKAAGKWVTGNEKEPSSITKTNGESGDTGKTEKNRQSNYQAPSTSSDQLFSTPEPSPTSISSNSGESADPRLNKVIKVVHYCRRSFGSPATEFETYTSRSFPVLVDQELDQDKKYSNYGIIDNANQNPMQALVQKKCTTPQFVDFTQGRRKKSEFFKLLNGKAFEDEAVLSREHFSSKFHIHFAKSDTRNLANPLLKMIKSFQNHYFLNSEYVLAWKGSRQKPGRVIENRLIAYDKFSPAWKLNTCNQAVTLVGSGCEWKKNKKARSRFKLNYKDFFYLPGLNAMGVIVYCSKNGKNWEDLGGFTLYQTND